MSDTSSELSPAERETIGAVLGRTPSGVFVLTATDGDGNETGMLASWVQQASFEPPMVSVGVNKSRYLNEWLQKVPKVALSLVGESQNHFLKHFGRGFEPGQAAFEGLEVTRNQTGLPLLADSLGYLEGPVTGQVEAGDHIIYLMEIAAAGAGTDLEHQRPRVHIRKSGFSY